MLKGWLRELRMQLDHRYLKTLSFMYRLHIFNRHTETLGSQNLPQMLHGAMVICITSFHWLFGRCCDPLHESLGIEWTENPRILASTRRISTQRILGEENLCEYLPRSVCSIWHNVLLLKLYQMDVQLNKQSWVLWYPPNWRVIFVFSCSQILQSNKHRNRALDK